MGLFLLFHSLHLSGLSDEIRVMCWVELELGIEHIVRLGHIIDVGQINTEFMQHELIRSTLLMWFLLLLDLLFSLSTESH